MNKPKPLTPAHWVEAAFRALTKNGPHGIRAEVIARDLKVSKGSFYWHFENVAALKRSMLKHWKQAATEAVILLIEESEASPKEQLELLLSIATGNNSAPYGGVLTESAIRDWARYDKAAARAVVAVNKKRLAYLEKLFTAHGAEPKIAKTNASILYGALIGLESLSHRGLAELQNDLQHLLKQLLRDD